MTDAIPEAVRDYITAHTRKAGEYEYLVDEAGLARFHSSEPGAPNWTPADLAAWTKTARPELWGNEPVMVAPADARPPAPRNATEAMLAVREGRMTAEQATALAIGLAIPSVR